MRYQFSLQHVFVLVLIIAFAMALFVQRQGYERIQAEQAAELTRAHGVLRQNNLDWQLSDLSKDRVRIIVDDFYGDGPIKGSLSDFVARKITLRTIGPAKIFLLRPSDHGKGLLVETDAAPGEAATASIPILARRLNDGRSRWATFSLMLPGQLEQGTVESQQQMKELFRFELASGDYDRGKPIDLYTRGDGGEPRTWRLLVK